MDGAASTGRTLNGSNAQRVELAGKLRKVEGYTFDTNSSQQNKYPRERKAKIQMLSRSHVINVWSCRDTLSVHLINLWRVVTLGLIEFKFQTIRRQDVHSDSVKIKSGSKWSYVKNLFFFSEMKSLRHTYEVYIFIR